jgi:hypothetical protein
MSYKFNPFTGTLDEVGAGGGAATPGGADTQVQFNDGGSFAGDSGLTYDDAAGALTVGGKTVTTDAPIINLSQTWNNAATTFTGLKLNVTNTASAAGSNLLNLQVGGTSNFTVSSAGGARAATLIQGPSSIFYNFTVSNGVNLRSDYVLKWYNGPNLNSAGAYDVGLARDSAGVVKVTDGSAGTGYLKLIPTTVGALTAAATVGAGTKAFVTDATNTLASHHGDVVAGGGSNFTPVYSDGTDWRIG